MPSSAVIEYRKRVKHAAMTELVERSQLYKKNIEPELVEETIEDEERAPLIAEFNELVKRIKKIQTKDHFDIVEYGMRETEEGGDMYEVSIESFSNDGIREVIENLTNILQEGEEEK